jgi:hypothetical protein
MEGDEGDNESEMLVRLSYHDDSEELFEDEDNDIEYFMNVDEVVADYL